MGSGFFFFLGQFIFPSFHFHFTSIVASYEPTFSCISFSLVHLFASYLFFLFHFVFNSISKHVLTAIVIMQFLYSFSCQSHCCHCHAMPHFFFFLLIKILSSHIFSCGWECSVAIATIISAFLPVAHATHNAPSSSFPRIERSVCLTPSHALQFPPLSLFRYPALHFYVAVLVLVHLFFSSPPAFLTVSAINRGVRTPPHVILHAMRLAQRSNGARFVSTTQWVRLFPLENTWKRYGRYNGSSGRRPNAATIRMGDLTNTAVIRITEAA